LQVNTLRWEEYCQVRNRTGNASSHYQRLVIRRHRNRLHSTHPRQGAFTRPLYRVASHGFKCMIPIPDRKRGNSIWNWNARHGGRAQNAKRFGRQGESPLTALALWPGNPGRRHPLRGGARLRQQRQEKNCPTNPGEHHLAPTCGGTNLWRHQPVAAPTLLYYRMTQATCQQVFSTFLLRGKPPQS